MIDYTRLQTNTVDQKNKTKSFLFINYAMLSKRKKEILALEAPAVIISKSSIIKQFKNIYIKDARCS